MQSYKNKTALVTGASSGIGLAIANSLARRGAHLILTARSTDMLNKIATTIKKKGVKADVFTCDLSQTGAAQYLYEAIMHAGLEVDLLVNNAGYGRWGNFTEFDRKDYDQMIRLNITTPTELCHLFIPEMISRGSGGIINIGSITSFVPTPYAAVYAASKAYILHFSDALRYEYSDQGVRIMTICPGFTDTNFRTVAAVNINVDLGGAGTPAEEVAEQGLDAFLNGKVYVVTGKGNNIFTILPRLLTRKRVLNLIGNNFRKQLGR